MATEHQVKIHLTIHKASEDINVDFGFDVLHDNIDEVVGDLVKTLQLTDQDEAKIKEMIRKQIDNTGKRRTTMDDSSDGPVDDPEYAELIETQKRQLEEMDKRHQQEQTLLIQKLTTPQNVDDLLIF